MHISNKMTEINFQPVVYSNSPVYMTFFYYIKQILVHNILVLFNCTVLYICLHGVLKDILSFYWWFLSRWDDILLVIILSLRWHSTDDYSLAEMTFYWWVTSRWDGILLVITLSLRWHTLYGARVTSEVYTISSVCVTCVAQVTKGCVKGYTPLQLCVWRFNKIHAGQNVSWIQQWYNMIHSNSASYYAPNRINISGVSLLILSLTRICLVTHDW